MPVSSTTTRTRPAAVAGSFYPGAADELRRTVVDLLAGVVAPTPTVDGGLKAIVVPHAGLQYSGAVAAAAYALLRGRVLGIRRVVLIGPSHRVDFDGLAVPAADAFETPLGRVPLDGAGREALAGQPAVLVSDRPHQREHSLEVQLPFLQIVLGQFTLLPIVTGEAAPGEVAEVLGRVWGGAETLVVVSTDLSHFHADAAARALDAATAERVRALDATLDGEDACGCVGLNGFLRAAAARRLVPVQLCLRNSADVTADRARVVGYGAFAFHEPVAAVG